jgi:N-formylglutamate amidohydrolase
MDEEQQDQSDSTVIRGGSVPGHPEVPAFTLRHREPSPIPVLIAVPHAGRAYASTLLDRMRNPAYAAPRLEDRYVDLLAKEIARATGASLLVAHAPRAMIDLNRATDDVDWDMMGMPAPDASAAPPGAFGRRARSGLGLIPRRLPGLGELWKRRMDHGELEARIEGVHVPYHEALADTLARLHRRWGAALLLDLHSMPPLSPRSGIEQSPEFVIGDRFGASCDGSLVASAFGFLAEARRPAAHNRPYAGGYVLERHAARRQGLHCMQLEIDRQRYLDFRMVEPGPGFADMVALLIGLVRRLAGDVAALGRESPTVGDAGLWRDAAE